MSTILASGKFLKLVCEGHWEFVERVNARGVVAIAAMTSDRRIVLTEQFRPAVGQLVIDLPAGLAGDIAGQEDEALEASASRELLEETGYVAKKLERAADCPSSPGLTSEIVTMFVARDVEAAGDGGGVDGESIVVHIPTIRGIDRWISSQAAAGKLIDAKVFAGLYLAKRRVSRAVTQPRKSRKRSR